MLSDAEYSHHKEIVMEDIRAIERNLSELEAPKNQTEEQITGEMKWKQMIRRFHDATEISEEMADAFIETMKIHEDGTLEIKLSYIYDYYSKDLSKKVKSAMGMKQEKAKFVNTVPYKRQSRGVESLSEAPMTSQTEFTSALIAAENLRKPMGPYLLVRHIGITMAVRVKMSAGGKAHLKKSSLKR